MDRDKQQKLTLDKERLLLSTGLVWNDFIGIYERDEAPHPDDINDFRFHIHAIQNIIKSQLSDDYSRELRLRTINDASEIIREFKRVNISNTYNQ